MVLFAGIGGHELIQPVGQYVGQDLFGFGPEEQAGQVENAAVGDCQGESKSVESIIDDQGGAGAVILELEDALNH